jgi:peptide/nickel transport system ATP-binding protein
MYLGEIVEEAETSALFTDPKHPYSEVLVSSIPTPDPTDTRERIRLAGDVPTPVDPPGGCRFHPRCPKVIRPVDWAHSQALWRRILHLKKRIGNETVEPKAMRSALETEREEPVSDDDVIDELYEEHITGGGIQDTVVDPPEQIERTVRDALSRLVSGDRSGAVDALHEEFQTVCEQTVPTDFDVEGRRFACHLHDPDIEGSSQDSV